MTAPDPIHPLDLATRLDGAPADPVRGGHASEAYWAFIGPFGGALAATVLRAVLEHPQRSGDPLALTLNFCAPMALAPFEVATRLARSNRSTQHWSVEVAQADAGITHTATLVTALRRDTWSHQPAEAPQLLPPQSLPRYAYRGAMSWVERYEFRFAQGAPELTETVPEPPASARSLLWINDAQPRPLDFPALASMSDAFFGRIFQVQGRMLPFGTVSMTTYFHASAEEVAAQGTAPLRASVDARVFHRSFCDQSGELWGHDGRLLATAVQIAYFRA